MEQSLAVCVAPVDWMCAVESEGDQLLTNDVPEKKSIFYTSRWKTHLRYKLTKCLKSNYKH